jgi:hypothetical protein
MEREKCRWEDGRGDNGSGRREGGDEQIKGNLEDRGTSGRRKEQVRRGSGGKE